MSLNQVYDDAHQLEVPVPEGTESGEALLVGVIPGVAQTDRNAAGEATVRFKGAFRLAVVSKEGETNKTTAVGDAIFITGAGVLEKKSSGNTLFGYALETIGSGATKEIVVKIAQA